MAREKKTYYVLGKLVGESIMSRASKILKKINEASELTQAIVNHANGSKPLKVGDKFKNAVGKMVTVTDVGSHTIQVKTDDGWSSAIQIPFLGPDGETTAAWANAMYDLNRSTHEDNSRQVNLGKDRNDVQWVFDAENHIVYTKIGNGFGRSFDQHDIDLPSWVKDKVARATDNPRSGFNYQDESAGEYHVFIKVPSRNQAYLAQSCKSMADAQRAMDSLIKQDNASGGCIKIERSTIEPHTAENIWNQAETGIRQGNIDTGGTAGKGTATHESKGTVFFWLPNSTKAEEEEVEANDRGEAMAKIRKKYPEAKAISCHMNDFKQEPKANEGYQDPCTICKIEGPLFKQRMIVKGFKSGQDKDEWLNKQYNNDWHDTKDQSLKPGTYAFAGGRWLNIKDVDPTLLAHI
jgi:hypothetical protein